MKTEPIICDGCKVEPGWEHRCHGNSSVVGGEQTNKPCQCGFCREVENLSPSEWEMVLCKPGI